MNVMIVRYGRGLMKAIEERTFTIHFFTPRTSSLNFKLLNIQNAPTKIGERVLKSFTAVFISVDALRALTSMKIAVCCYSLWSPMSDASRQTLCKAL
jgi:hypothetical protein